MVVNKEFLKKASFWSLAFLFHFLIVHFVFKPRGITYDSENSWIAGCFSLVYLLLVSVAVWQKKVFIVKWNQVLLLFFYALSFAGFSVCLVYCYQLLHSVLPPVIIQGADTPFLWYSYIFPRSANIIYQQLMIFFLLQLIDDYYSETKEQSLWMSLVFGITHLPVFLIVPNVYIALTMLCGAYLFGYILPILYKKFTPNGLYIGYAIHYSFYLLVSPIGYFLFRIIK